MTNRIILGTVLTLALTLSTNLGDRGVLAGMPLGQSDPPRRQPTTPAPASAPAAPASIGETTHLPPLALPRFSRFDAGRLSDRLVEQASLYLHAPYCRGASLQTGRATDCSGFVQYIYQKANISLPRASAAQARVGKVAARRMDFPKLTPGDLLFFRDGGRHIGHVGIYLGEGRMIHASSSRRGVTVSSLDQPYYLHNFVVAKRLLQGTPGGKDLAEQNSARPSLN